MTHRGGIKPMAFLVPLPTVYAQIDWNVNARRAEHLMACFRPFKHFIILYQDSLFSLRLLSSGLVAQHILNDIARDDVVPSCGPWEVVAKYTLGSLKDHEDMLFRYTLYTQRKYVALSIANLRKSLYLEMVIILYFSLHQYISIVLCCIVSLDLRT